MRGVLGGMVRSAAVFLGLVGLLFMFLTPVGLIVAWWHPAFRQRNRRDPLLVAAVWVYLAMLAGFVALAFVEESSGKVAPGERVSPARKNDRR